MKGDFTRFTFDSRKHYKSVLMQQGRAVLDADWNEQADIEEHIREAEVNDIVGRCATPIDCAGFKLEVSPDGRDLMLSSGRTYVDGILCELDEVLGYFRDATFDGPSAEDSTRLTISYECELDLKEVQWVEISAKADEKASCDSSPEGSFLQDLMLTQVLRIKKIAKDSDAGKMTLTFEDAVNEELKNAAKSNGIYIKNLLKIDSNSIMAKGTPGIVLAYLDVWNRHITSVEDDNIREKALKGPDTSTRSKAEWQARLLRCVLEDSPEKLSCQQASLMLKELVGQAASHLAARLQPAQKESAKDLCAAISGASYKGQDNQLYRVEIHQPGGVGEATFKWSRDNGAIAFAIEDFIPDESEGSETANSEASAKFHRVKLGRLGWDETLRIHEEDIVEVLGDETELMGKPGTLARVKEIEEADMILTLTADVSGHANESNPRVRRWDIEENDNGESSSIAGMPTGTGSEKSGWIELEKGIEVCFKTGDNYQTGDFWLIAARNTGNIEWPYEQNIFVPKFGIRHHRCLLAILRLNADGIWSVERDCRKLFSPLSEMVLLSYLGGDGQEAMPGYWLPAPFEVRVTRGDRPVEGAHIAFEIEGQGILDPADGYVTTGIDGIARCKCRLNDKMECPNLRIAAKLLDPAVHCERGNLFYPRIFFNANASIAEQVAYSPPKECPQIGDAKTVRDAIDGLCRQVSFNYVGGDGQEALPGNKLPGPFRVRVTRGSQPVVGAVVNFRIDSGKGMLESDKAGTDLDIETDAAGIAACYCILYENATIEAKLVKPAPTSPDKSRTIWFNANVSVAEQVAYSPPENCRQLAGTKTVKAAIDDLCRQFSFSYAGGDGQEAIPGNVLPVPFSVRVSRGSYPVQDALVTFKIESGKGELREKRGERGKDELEIKTNENGIAECFFKIDESAVILARISDPRAVDQSYIMFSAGVSRAQNIEYLPSPDCKKLDGVQNVKQAVDKLCLLHSSTEKTLTTWVHGNSLHLQINSERGGISLRYDDENGQVAVVKGEKGSSAKICFSIPVISDPNSKTLPTAVAAILRAKANEKLDGIIHISDGETNILKGEITILNNWETNIRLALDNKSISLGIGITLIINFISPNEIWFSAAGCTIKSNCGA